MKPYNWSRTNWNLATRRVSCDRRSGFGIMLRLMDTLTPRPSPPTPDPRGWALHHAQMARTASISARESLSAAPDQRTIATALCAIAEALTSIAWTEAHPPRRYPFRQAVVNGVPLDREAVPE